MVSKGGVGRSDEELARQMLAAWLQQHLPGTAIGSEYSDRDGRQSAADYQFQIGGARFWVEVTGVHERLYVGSRKTTATEAEAVLDDLICRIRASAEQRELAGYFVISGIRVLSDPIQKRKSDVQTKALDYMTRMQGVSDASEELLTDDGFGRSLVISKMPLPSAGVTVEYSPSAVRWDQQVVEELTASLLDAVWKKAAAARKRGGSHILVLLNMNHFAELRHYQGIIAGLHEQRSLSAFHAVFLCVRSGCSPLCPEGEPDEGWQAFFRTQQVDVAPSED